MMAVIMAEAIMVTAHRRLPVMALTIGVLIIGDQTTEDLTAEDMTGAGSTIVGDLMVREWNAGDLMGMTEAGSTIVGDLMAKEWNAGDQTVAAGWNGAIWATARDHVWNAVAEVTGKAPAWNGANGPRV